MRKLFAMLLCATFALCALPSFAAAGDGDLKSHFDAVESDVKKLDSLTSKLDPKTPLDDLVSVAKAIQSHAAELRTAAKAAKLDAKIVGAIDDLEATAIKLGDIKGESKATVVGDLTKTQRTALNEAAVDIEKRFEAVSGLVEPVITR